MCNGTQDAVAQAATGMDRTRFAQVGEPDILAATSGWQQGPPAARTRADGTAGLPGQYPEKNAPGEPGAFNGNLADAAYLALDTGAEDAAFFAWWCFLT